ncbi:MAG: pyruvate formate lyase family protein [Lachnospiraceae bacterium]|nr:pyruvate formate lyase family protein [Lachnospiraceae bacterium]
MTIYRFDKEQFFEENEKVYSEYPSDVSQMEGLLNRRNKENPDASSFRKKTWVYRTAAEHAEVIIFPASPFFSEIDTGRERNSVTATFPPQPGIGCWLMKQYPKFVSDYGKWSDYYKNEGVMNGPQFMDAAHHYANCETVVKYGLDGICKKTEERLEDKKLSGHQGEFLTCVIDICGSLKKIANRFSDKAKDMLLTDLDPMHQLTLKKIAETACKVPAKSAESFYEALSAIWFTREMCNALDGLGFAVIGHLDRILNPYYEKDIASGVLTKEEAQEYMDCFISMTDARWDLESDLPGGTNADVVIGGCEPDGTIIYNEVSKMVMESFRKYRFANPKLQARVSVNHPDDFLNRLGELAGMGLNVLSIFNDDVIINANHMRNKKLADCRMYVAGGCQEICLSNEVNSRAYTYLNLVQMLNGSLYPDYWNKVFSEDGLSFVSARKADTFEAFYDIVMDNYKNELNMFVRKYNEFGAWWKTINPSLFFSATMLSCIEKAKDVSEGGAVYNTDNFAATGIGTVIDSLYAIKTAVFDRKVVSMEKLLNAMENNFQNDEMLRQYLLHKVPKFCRDKEVTTFGARVMKDLSERLGGQKNYRGGFFEPSLFAFYSYDWFKETTVATADGRACGTGLSRGVNPSESTENVNISTLLNALKDLDYSYFPGGAVTYMDIPIMYNMPKPELFAGVIKVFCENGGSVMDFNVISQKILLDAQKKPESHQNIVVRVCGYSAYFHTLTTEMQNEVIGRTQR